eukprot:gene2324-2633_t
MTDIDDIKNVVQLDSDYVGKQLVYLYLKYKDDATEMGAGGRLENRSSKKTLVEVVRGNILVEPTDCIVNAANERLAHGGGVAGAISRGAGKKLDDESYEYVRKNGPVKTGSAAATGAGKLPFKCVIHAVAPIYFKKNADECADLVRSAITCSLQIAVDRQCKSISIPAIGSGIFGVPLDVSAYSIMQAIHSFVEEHPNAFTNIRLCDINEGVLEYAREELARLQKSATPAAVVSADDKVDYTCYIKVVDRILTLLEIPSYFQSMEEQKIYNPEEYDRLVDEAKIHVQKANSLFKCLNVVFKDTNCVLESEIPTTTINKMIKMMLEYSNGKSEWSSQSISKSVEDMTNVAVKYTHSASVYEMFDNKRKYLVELFKPLESDNEHTWTYNIVLVDSFLSFVTLVNNDSIIDLVSNFNPQLTKIIENLIQSATVVLFALYKVNSSDIEHPLFIEKESAEQTQQQKAYKPLTTPTTPSESYDRYQSMVDLFVNIMTDSKSSMTKKMCIVNHTLELFKVMGIYMTIHFK